MSESEKEQRTAQMTHWIIHALYGIVLACGGFITAQVFANLEKLQDKVDNVPNVYVQKADYNRDQDRLFDAIKSIGEKIDGLAAKLPTK